MTLTIGTTLSQRFEILAFAGSDGAFEVYKALDLRLGRDVALTVLELHSIEDPDNLLRFEREAQIRANLQHPRLVTVHDFGHDASCAFQVAEWLEGGSLQERLQAGPLDWPEAKALGEAVLDGLTAIRASGFALNTLDETSVFLQEGAGPKLFAYDLKRIEQTCDREREEIQALAQLMLRGMGFSECAQVSASGSKELAELRELAESSGFDQALRRRRFEALVRMNHPVPRRHHPWLVAALVLIGLGLLHLAADPKLRLRFPWKSRPPGPGASSEHGGNIDVRRCYLQGMQLLEDGAPVDLNKARNHFQESLALDPNYALSYAGLADCHNLMGLAGMLPREEAIRLSMESSRRALDIDAGQGEARASRAFVKFWHERDPQEAEKLYRAAVQLAPRQARLHKELGVFLSMTGRSKEGLDHLKSALALDPLSHSYRVSYAVHLHWAGRSGESLDEFAKVMEDENSHPDGLLRCREVLEQIGQINEALRISARLADLGVISEQEASSLQSAFESDGMKGYWRERIRLVELSPLPDPVQLASVVALQGDHQRALRLLDRAIRENSLLVPRIPCDPAFVRLRQDPRFLLLVNRMSRPES